MKFVAFVCIAAVCLIMSVLYAIFGDKKNGNGFVVRAITLFSILALSLISVYLKSMTNIIGLFVSLSCGALMLGEMLDDENKKWFCKIFMALAYALLLAAVVSIMEFSLFPLLGGLLFGLSVGFVAWAFNGEKSATNTILNIIQFILLGGAIGFGAINLLGFRRFIFSAMIFGACVFILIGTFMKYLNSENRTINMLSRVFISIGFAVIAGSTYFY